jgi:hypothetical protein
MDGLTFAALLTAAGAGIAAGIVTSVVSLIKTSVPVVKEMDGAGLAFALSGVLYVLAAVATNVSSLDGALGVFLAWLTCATAAVGVHSFIVKPVIAQIKG